MHPVVYCISEMGDMDPTRQELEVRRTPADQSLRRMCPTRRWACIELRRARYMLVLLISGKRWPGTAQYQVVNAGIIGGGVAAVGKRKLREGFYRNRKQNPVRELTLRVSPHSS